MYSVESVESGKSYIHFFSILRHPTRPVMCTDFMEHRKKQEKKNQNISKKKTKTLMPTLWSTAIIIVF